jgi:hypothetical protein
MISITDPYQISNSDPLDGDDSDAADDPCDYTRMIREIVSVLGAEIMTVVEPPAGRVTSLRLTRAQN